MSRLAWTTILATLPTMALANAGTPLIWFGCLWLFLGNLAIGAFEAWLIRRQVPETALDGNRTMLIGNYASAIAGILVLNLLSPVSEWASLQPSARGVPVFVAFFVAMYVLTLAIEAPFVAKQSGLPLRSSKLWKLNLRVQAISYGGLVLICLAISPGIFSAPREGNVRTAPGWVYFIALDRREIVRVRTEGSQVEHVMNVPDDVDLSRGIYIERTRNGRARLVAGDMQPRELLHLGDARQTPPAEAFDANGFTKSRVLFGMYMGKAQFANPGNVRARTGFWSAEGLFVGDESFSFETPFLHFPWRDATTMPDGKVIAQYGESIVLLDPKRRVVQTLAQGTMPAVLLE